MDQEWALMFAKEYLRQAEGRGNLHDLIDWGYELHPTMGHLDATEVARREYVRSAQTPRSSSFYSRDRQSPFPRR